ncbi:MAG: hypothetical protein KDK34_16360, partial [Leptospiraceae bacterium]|nr:hypothetical protein [Leptospiraceae bacterium]
FEEAFKKSGHYYIANFGTQLEEKSGGKNYNCAPLDFHWNILGNQLAGQLLYMHINDIARRESLIQ